MKKVKNIFIATEKEVGGSCSTGLVLELEDGTLLRHQSTDPIMAFEKFTPTKA
jgi:hypothetical protein